MRLLFSGKKKNERHKPRQAISVNMQFIIDVILHLASDHFDVCLNYVQFIEKQSIIL